MPGFNQKGPMGKGSMSGKKMGKCTNFDANVKHEISFTNATSTESSPEYNAGRVFGVGNSIGQGRGMGMGRQHRFRNGQ